MRKPYFPLGDWRRNLLLTAAAASLGLALPACSGNTESDRATTETGSWDNAADSYSQGVITELTEVQPDKWQITAERPAGKEEVAAILKHFDGKVDTLQGQALQQQMRQYSQQHPENQTVSSGGGGLMNILMWSSLGYMAGRFLTPQPAAYANPGVLQQNRGWRSQVARERDQGRSFFGRGFSGTRTAIGNSGIRPSSSVVRSTGTSGRSNIRTSAPSGRSSGFGSRGYGGRGFGG
ncbi:hypothetical protein MUN82_16450 [Hymenobacter aerilatus]|uniref:UPF0323 domain-containing protein n=1 Tax=Hymenobacter aerilatus TaxID=2932251 RepID=A0A8T9SRS2_9BACT|nr:hypothetical protein [Hymenobacter aerilatus]UOR04525.1 hypothetical protein MUN82_16450 [Hymenobacter aerilatus]